MPLPRKVAARVLLPVLILLGGGAGVAYLRATAPQLDAKPIAEKTWPVAVTSVTIAAERPRLVLEGEVVAGREAELRPLVAGTIEHLADNFRDGALLRKGEAVLRIDPFAYQATAQERRAELAQGRARQTELEGEIEAEKRQLEHSNEQWELARQDLRRYQSLNRRGTISDREVESARVLESQRRQSVLNHEQAITRLQAQLEQQRATVDRLDWALRRGERNLEETVLTAPFDGVLHETNAAVGKQVGTSDKLARLVALAELEVRFHVPDALYASLSEGRLDEREAVVRWRVGETVRAYPAVLDRVDARIQAASGGVLMYARLPGLDLSTDLRPGAFVTIEITDRPLPGVARLPQRALFDGDTVYVVGEDGRLDGRAVVAVVREAGDVLVRGPLKDGERVVLTRFPEIAPGVKVTIP